MARRKRDAAAAGEPVPRELPEAELEVLACLWQRKQATARQVREAMAPYRPMTHGAMATLLTRLLAKGLVARKKSGMGKAFLYFPTRVPEATYRRVMRDLRDRIFGGSGVTMVASLFETRPPTADELDQLQTLLDDLRARREHTENEP